MRYAILYIVFLAPTLAFAEGFFFEAGEHNLECECVATGAGQGACKLFGSVGTEPHTWYRKIHIAKAGNYDISFLTHACYRDALKGAEGIVCCAPDTSSDEDIAKFYRAKP